MWTDFRGSGQCSFDPFSMPYGQFIQSLFQEYGVDAYIAEHPASGSLPEVLKSYVTRSDALVALITKQESPWQHTTGRKRCGWTWKSCWYIIKQKVNWTMMDEEQELAFKEAVERVGNLYQTDMIVLYMKGDKIKVTGNVSMDSLTPMLLKLLVR